MTTGRNSTPPKNNLINQQKISLLLGAGASVEAGIPTARQVTDRLLNYSTYCPSDEGIAIENALRYIQVRLADYLGSRTREINFEEVVGSLLEIARRPEDIAYPLLGDADQVVRRLQEHISLDLAIQRVHGLLREIFLRTGTLNHLQPLADFCRQFRPVDIFTLNYDTTIESAFDRHSEIGYTTGYPERLAPSREWSPELFEMAHWDVRLFKLHGSVNWGRFFAVEHIARLRRLTQSGLFAKERFANYPQPIAFDPYFFNRTELPGKKTGMESIMNYGTRKELLYSSSQFTVLFHHFLLSLQTSNMVIVIGYSFNDDRINVFLEESLCRSEGGLKLMIINPDSAGVKRSAPFLGAGEEFGLVRFVNDKFGSVLAGDKLARLCAEFLGEEWRSQSLLKRHRFSEMPVDQTEIFEPSLSPAQRIDFTIRHWHELGVNLDLASYWFELLGECSTQFSEILTDSELETLRQIIMPITRTIRDVLMDWNDLYKSLGYGLVYDEKSLREVSPYRIIHSKEIKNQDLRRECGNAYMWFGPAYSTYYDIRKEIVEGVVNENYGKEIKAPSNIQMVELRLRKLFDRLEDARAAMNKLLEFLGCGRPFDFENKPVDSSEDPNP